MKKVIAAALTAAALAVPAAPAAADDSGRAGVSKCTGGGYHGVYVWYYDLDGNYHRTYTCIYTGP